MSSPDKTRAERSLREKGSRKTDDCGGLYGRSRAGRTRRLAFAAMFAAPLLGRIVDSLGVKKALVFEGTYMFSVFALFGPVSYTQLDVYKRQFPL